MKKKTLARGTYVLMSVGLASLIIWTALPYYQLTSLSFPGRSIYWNYAEVQRGMYVLFPCLALLGAVTTLKKRPSLEDIFLNCAQGIIVLLVLKVFQYHPVISFVVLMYTLGFIAYRAIDYFLEESPEEEPLFKSIRIFYYKARRIAVYTLLFCFSPLAIWVSFQEKAYNSRYLTVLSLMAEEETVEEENLFDVVGAREWENLAVESRFEEIRKAAKYFLRDCGVGEVQLYAVKELTDGTLAYYSDNTNSISFNILYLEDCSLVEAVEVTAHEVYHKYEHELIRSLDTLKKAGMNCSQMPFFKEAVELENANIRYGIDKLTMEGYQNNLLEVRSNEYAERMVSQLREEGYFD